MSTDRRSTPAETPAPRPPLPRPDTSRSYGPRGRGKVKGSQRGNQTGKQFAFRKH